MYRRTYFLLLLLLGCMLRASAQQYFLLQADQLKIDSVLPQFTFVKELGPAYADSTYEVTIEYPDFVPMKRSEVRRYKKITGQSLPEWPDVNSYLGVSRRVGSLYASFVPLLRRDGKNLKIQRFKLSVVAKEKKHLTTPAVHSPLLASGDEPDRRTHLSEGRWVKISVPTTGFYQLTDSLLRAAGFTDPQRVKIYGYGGALQPEVLTADYLAATDGLPQLPTCMVGQRRLFYGVGPINWESAVSVHRTCNYYSRVGCYLLTDSGDDAPLMLDEAGFLGTYYPSANDYHTLYEVDDFAWYHGGRNLYDRRLFGQNVARSYKLPTHGRSQGKLTVTMSYKGYCKATVSVGDLQVGEILIDEQTTTGIGKKQYLDSYSKAAVDVWSYNVSGLPADTAVVTIRQLSGADMRLDNIEMTFQEPRPKPDFLHAQLPEPDVVGNVAPQNRHADEAADMIIIIPPSGKLQEQAERLAQLHATYDSLRVRVVKADELYNEFSSGTPDANAYRRYLKMLYDHAETPADMPRYLLLFGDGVYDNRRLTSDFSQLNPDDLLLCYESENSMSETACYVSDDFFGMLDEGEGGDLVKTDKGDVAIGRFPARTPEEARVLVDKAYSYRLNEHAGTWQNTICFMGDDGNANMHMNDAETVASIVADQWPAYHLKKIYWDAYQRTSSVRGYAYPDVTNLIRQQMREGALLMNYSGHGATFMLSHEYVVTLPDFKDSVSVHYPLWFTASCDVSPFDGHEENIGEQAMFNPYGGAIAFLGTTRTVYALHNRAMNRAFTTHVLSLDHNGQRNPIGEAVRMAKNDQVQGSKTLQQAGINKLHYVLLGDPALSLPFPTASIVVDSINGHPVDEGLQELTAGLMATVQGHVEDHDDFNGVVTLTVKDAEQTIQCRMNPLSEDEMPKRPLVYRDRPGTLFVGSDSVRNGKFVVTFVLPKDISYSDDPGLFLLHAVSNDRRLIAHGSDQSFVMKSADTYDVNGEGPSISLRLDIPTSAEGHLLTSQPHMHVELADEDGINASGSGIGHNLELCIDGLQRYTYNLNSYFQYHFGDFRSGIIDFTLPQLDEGQHELLFRAWDVLNNSSTVSQSFVVGSVLSPTGIDTMESGSLANGRSAQGQAYDLQGRQVSTPRAGLLLMRFADGKVKKILKKGNN